MNLELDDIPPGYTPTVQPRSLPGLATVGSPIASTYASGIYSFDVTSLANADYEFELIGVSVPTRKFYVRKTSTSAFVITTPGGASYPPPSTPTTCRVLVIATRGAVGVQARLRIETSNVGRETERAFMNLAYDALTDVDGSALVDLAWSSQPGVGQYRFRFLEPVTNIVWHDRLCTVPDITNADYEDLTSS